MNNKMRSKKQIYNSFMIIVDDFNRNDRITWARTAYQM